MRESLLATLVLWILYMPGARAQNPPPEPDSTVPLYRVTVVDRTISAVDYQYRNGPTPIDFRGTY